PIEKVLASTASKAPVFLPVPMSVSIRLMLGFLICILGCSQLQAQPRDRTLSGKVTTPSGTPVANARVVVKNSTGSDIRSVTVKGDGTYVVVKLLPGTYEVTVSAQGFVDARTTTTLGANSNPELNLVLKPFSTAVAGE